MGVLPMAGKMLTSPLENPLVLFDMDCVLADTDRAYFEITGEAYDHTQPWTDERRQKFYTEHANFFSNLPWIKGSRLLFNYACTVARVGICSSMSKHLTDRCREQKIEWLTKHRIIKDCDPIIITPPHANKGDYATPGAILIDDYDVNIQRWEAAGGIGIHFRSPRQAFDDLHRHIKPGIHYGTYAAYI